MRSRNIKPGFFKNENLADCDPLSRILFTGLWCYADREGRFEWRPKRIKIEILPYDDCDIESLLLQLIEKGFLEQYTIDNKSYIQINNWHKHQRPHHMEAGSEIPPILGMQNKYNDEPVTASQKNRIFNRDGRKCVKCGDKKSLHIDHIIPRSKGGTSLDSNLQTLCQKCNLSKSNNMDHEQSVHASCMEQNKGLSPSDTGYLIPDSLIPDSLIPDSLIPDSLIPDSLNKNTMSQSEDCDRVKRFQLPKFPKNSEPIWLSELFYELILKNDPKAKEPNYQKWGDHIDKLHRIDGRSYDEIEKVIRWTQQHEFEKTVVLSPTKLRKRYAQLRLKWLREKPNNRIEKQFGGVRSWLEKERRKECAIQ